MKRIKITDIIERAHSLRYFPNTDAFKHMTNKITQYASFTRNCEVMYLLVLDENGKEHGFRITPHVNDSKILRHNLNDVYDAAFIRTFTESINNLNDGRLKMFVDTKLYI